MADGLPPWLNIDPVAPVGRLLEGYRAGLSASEAQTAAAQRAQQMAIAQAQAAENSRIRQEQNALEAKQFEMQFRLKEQEAQRAAQEAAIQLEGMNELQRRTAGGEPFAQVWAEIAPKILYRHPERIPQAMQAVAPPQFGTTPEGIPYGMGRSGGISYVPAAYMRQGFTPQIHTFGEGPDTVRAIETSPGQWRPIKGQQEGTLTQVERAELQKLNRREANLYRTLGGLTEEEAAQDPVLKKVVDDIATIEDERQSIYSGTWKPGEATAPTAPTVLPLPAKKEELVNGHIYQTSRGPAKWDGEKFVQ
jgi:hypothetical protein